MQQTISSILAQSGNLKLKLSNDSHFLAQVEKATLALRKVINAGGTIYSCGNGGSACDAMHLTEELVARYKRERAGIRAMHFGDPGTLTCWGNDYQFESVYERQAEVFCEKNDALIGISTSARSKNVLRAVKAAKAKGALIIGLLGRDGGTIAPECDIPIIVPEQLTERTQEVHITVIHILMELLETEAAK